MAALVRLQLIVLASILACWPVSAQQVWSNLWTTVHGMEAIDADLATDEDNTTQMRVFPPILPGASLSVDLRSAAKITHVVRIAHPKLLHLLPPRQ